MERGARMEEEAVAAFEFDRGIDTEVVGFVTTDDGLAGCSPDRFAGSDEVVEIKCPGARYSRAPYARADSRQGLHDAIAGLPLDLRAEGD
jgi:hypothetical protein